MNKFFVMLIALFAMTTAASAEVFITIVKSEQQMYVDTPAESFVWKVSNKAPSKNWLKTLPSTSRNGRG